MLIDSHCHLDFNEYLENIDSVFQKAKDFGVTHAVAIGASDGIESSIKTVELVQNYPFLVATVGIHPHNASTYNKNIKNKLFDLAKNKKVVAIGEIGLDFHYNNSPKKIQIEVFKEQLEIAQQNNLPVVIHSREAEEETLKILKEYKEKYPELKVVVHCFSGTKQFAEKLLELGIFISFSGIITFKNSDKLRDIVKTVPLDSILIETDSPFLTPVPYRGKKNEPAYLKFVAEEIAKLKNLSFELISDITSKNCINFFNLDW